MEESEKRKERLKALQVEAAQAGVDNQCGNSIVGQYLSLANPLIEAFPSMNPEPRVAPRFDYYTDPMLAFSGNKTRSKVSYQISPDYFSTPRPVNPDLSFSAAHQVQTNYSPDPRIFQGNAYRSSGPFRSPMEIPDPFGTPKGKPNHWSGSSGLSTYCSPSNLSRGANLPGPSFRQGGSPGFSYHRGRGYSFDNSLQAGFGSRNIPYHNSGRGRGPGLGNSRSPGSVQSGRRGGSYNCQSAELRPDLFYDKSMVEDPWKMLKPVIWMRKDA